MADNTEKWSQNKDACMYVNTNLGNRLPAKLHLQKYWDKFIFKSNIWTNQEVSHENILGRVL